MFMYVSSQDCIPQYYEGHFRRVGTYELTRDYAPLCSVVFLCGCVVILESMRSFIKNNSLPLSLTGSSYDGVAVNDVIYSARTAVEELLGNGI